MRQTSNADEANEIDALLAKAADIMNNPDEFLPVATEAEALA
jgi:hypothetical protein